MTTPSIARRMLGPAFLCLAALLVAAPLSAAAPSPSPAHALAIHGAPKYPAGFAHFDYANPAAPKGGELRLYQLGTFDTLNPFTLKGIAPASPEVHESLLYQSLDEPFSSYGLLAESVTVADDRAWAEFALRPEARWHDGRPVTADDVVFSFTVLTRDGHPYWRTYYADVRTAEPTGERSVRFVFAEGGKNRELPLIIGQMPVLPKHYWQGRDFAASTLDPPLASGPYRIARAQAGRSVVYERVPDYWGRDLAVNRGRNNFDRIVYDYYRDDTAALQAFFGGQYDFREEASAKAWATSYDVPAVRDGRIKRERIPHRMPVGMAGFVFNTRRPALADRRVRAAIAHAFDFEWSNAALAGGAYTRSESYFANSDLAAAGLPQGEELEILARHRGKVPDEVFAAAFHAPRTDGSGNLRENLQTAQRLLKEAGWEVKGGVMTNAKTGAPLRLEILDKEPLFERWTLPFIANLKRIGIEARLRTVDTAQFKNRMDAYDFDLANAAFPQSLSPGNEQRDFWSSAKADVRGGHNYAGVRDPVVDELVELVIAAPDRESLVARTRALDRVLLWGHYVVPQWHIGAFRLAYWDKFGRPAQTPPFGLGVPDLWWAAAGAAAATGKAR